MSSLSQRVVEQIRAQIIGGQLHPGVKLPAESALERQFAVSRTVIREALTHLQAVGLVETHRGKGTYVLARPSDQTFTPDIARIQNVDDLVELVDFRLGCEVETAALAAVRRTEAEMEEIEIALIAFRAARELPSQAVQADFQFHRDIAVATHNRYFVDLLTSLGPTMITMPQIRLRSPDDADRDRHYDSVIVEHETIGASIRRQDILAAAAAMRTHLANSRARLAM